jgi:hypothetical protein
MHQEAAASLDAALGAALDQGVKQGVRFRGRGSEAPESNSQAGVAQRQSNCFVNSRSGVRIPAPALWSLVDLDRREFVRRQRRLEGSKLRFNLRQTIAA